MDSLVFILIFSLSASLTANVMLMNKNSKLMSERLELKLKLLKLTKRIQSSN